MKRILAVIVLVAASCAAAPSAEPSPRAPIAPEASAAPGQTLGCFSLFVARPPARCIDR